MTDGVVTIDFLPVAFQVQLDGAQGLRKAFVQNQTIRERTETLEILSARMLKSEESNKKKIAIELPG